MNDVAILVAAAFAAGFFGSAHCVGMCGPIVVLLEAERPALRRRMLHHAGRLVTYAALGATAAAGGASIAAATGSGLSALRLVAALLVVAIGMQLIGWGRPLAALERVGARLWQYVAPLTRVVLPATTPARALAAGMLWGFLPCGLVYGALAAAAASGTAASGAIVMAAFWAGTVPALVAGGAVMSALLGNRHRPTWRRVAGIMLALAGVLSLWLPAMHEPAAVSSSGHGAHLTMTAAPGAR